MENFDSFGYGMPTIGTGPEAEIFGYFMVAYLVVALLSFVYSVVVYVLQSLGMHTIAKHRGIHNPWLAWIPVANVWTLGSISDQYQYVAKGKVRNRRKVLLGLNIALIALMIPLFISYVGFLTSAVNSFANDADIMDIMGPMLLVLGFCLVILVVAIIQTVFMYVAYYDLFASCKPDSAVLFLVLTILFGFLLPYFVFACRKKDLGMPPRKAQLPEQPAAPAEPEPQPEKPEAIEESTEE